MVSSEGYTVISTFAGCGGSSLGYKWAGYKELLAIDFDKNAVETFRLNFDAPIWHRDVKEVTGAEILEFCNIKKGELDVLDGSPPCQGFSTAGKQEVSDNRNDLFLEYVRLINGLQPKVFVMENVSGMMKGKFKGKFNEILRTLKDTGYNVKCKLMNAKYYEVPQSRERLIFIGVRKDFEIMPAYPAPSKNIIKAKHIIPGALTNHNSSFKWKFIDDSFPTLTKTKAKNYMVKVGAIERYMDNSEIKKAFTFGDEFKMCGSDNDRIARLGNSVPPKMMHHIATTIRKEILDKIK